SCATGERDDPFALVAVERLLPGGGGLFAATGSLENLGQVVVGVALESGRARLLAVGECLSRESLGLAVVPSVSCDESGDPAPERLRHRVVLVAEVTALRGELFCFVIAADCTEHATAHRRIVGKCCRAFLLGQVVAEVAELVGGGGVVARELVEFPEP